MGVSPSGVNKRMNSYPSLQLNTSKVLFAMAVLGLLLPFLASAHTPACVITATPQAISAGGNTRLEWSADDPTLEWIGDNELLANILMPSSGSIDNGVGIVPVQGTRDVRPAQTTTYTLTVQGSFLGLIPGDAVTCSTTVTVNAAPSCTPSFSCSGNGILNSCTGQITQCAGDATCSNGQCIGAQCVLPEQCTPTYSCNGNGILNSCTGVTALCPSNSVCVDGQCTCPAGQIVENGRCTCPAGEVLQNGLCVTTLSGCGGPQLRCGIGANANKLYRRSFSNAPQCTATDELLATCEWGCAGGACLPPPLPELTITANPNLVKRGERSVITWSALNVRLCSVTGTNGDLWQAIIGAQDSKPIHESTTYTLQCTPLAGGIISKTAKVNIVPVWQEI